MRVRILHGNFSNMILTALLAFAIASCFWISLITGGYRGKRAAWILVLVLAMMLCHGCAFLSPLWNYERFKPTNDWSEDHRLETPKASGESHDHYGD